MQSLCVGQMCLHVGSEKRIGSFESVALSARNMLAVLARLVMVVDSVTIKNVGSDLHFYHY